MRDEKGRFVKGSNNWTGKSHTEESKTKMSNTRKKLYSEGKTKPTRFWKDKKFSIEHKNKISKNHRDYQTEETKEKLSISHKEDKNGMWKGADVKYGALHDWVRRRKIKPEFCENCKEGIPYDLANISGEYKRDINDFEWLCRRCHMNKDNRILNLKQFENEILQ